MYQQIEQRLEELNRQFEQGTARLQRLQRESKELGETLLRIRGAILVLDELSTHSGWRETAHNPEQETAEVSIPAPADPEAFED